ncbi:phage tail assembly protein, partial [Escherichia coli]|uniref:phage tail assembly protein n=1 Tax=Escherichia coli TaxID=562 RepID=UPI003D338FFD
VSKYIVRLAQVPKSSVDQMSQADLNAAAWIVAGFFLQALRLNTFLIASLIAPTPGAFTPSNF